MVSALKAVRQKDGSFKSGAKPKKVSVTLKSHIVWAIQHSPRNLIRIMMFAITFFACFYLAITGFTRLQAGREELLKLTMPVRTTLLQTPPHERGLVWGALGVAVGRQARRLSAVGMLRGGGERNPSRKEIPRSAAPCAAR